ncbi:MAG: CRISPR-associated endonuclease Cas1 [Candidatus Cloacimonadaceae bacterium]|nr:CRISPR-associated endonuclease Cas1 [Candidatus Cloacimonadaceae bacterium]MDP3115104.1 CRISPR-associated endonuclease Cas1 [Candidatus Cloacimonadaceae bacterium]
MEIHLNTYGSFIKKKDNMFEVSLEDKRVKLSPEKVSSIIISNAVNISSDAIQLAMDYNIDIVFLDKYGDPYARVWYPKLGSTTMIRRRQLEMLSEQLGLSFVKERITIKIMNQYRFAKRLISKRTSMADDYTEKLEKIRELAITIYNCEGTLEQLSGSLMGWEGGASKTYYGILANLIPDDFRFQGRSTRPAKDAFNAFLNYGYGILYSKVERALIIAGLDPYLGLLHKDNYNKKSFVFDFIETYRFFCDEPVFYIFSRRKMQPEFIESIHNGVILTTDGKKFFAPLLIEHFDEIIRYHNKNRKRIDQIQTDAHAFANFLIGKRDSYMDAALHTKLSNFLSSDDSDIEDEGD